MIPLVLVAGWGSAALVAYVCATIPFYTGLAVAVAQPGAMSPPAVVEPFGATQAP